MFTFRFADPGEVPRIFDFWVQIFKWPNLRPRRVLYANVAVGLESGLCKILLMEDQQGKLVGSVFYTMKTVHYGSPLREAHVGHVSIDPPRQGQGLGHKLMLENQQVPGRLGIDIATLGGLCRFYARFGYVPVPTVSYQVSLSPIRGGVKVISPADLLSVPPDRLKHIATLSERGEPHCWMPLHTKFYHNWPLAQVLEQEDRVFHHLKTGSPDDDIRRWGYWEHDRLVASLGAHDLWENPKIFDIMYDRDHPDAWQRLLDVMRYALSMIYEHGVDRVTLEIPDHPEWTEVLAPLSLKMERIEIHGTIGSSMAALIDPSGVLRKAATGIRFPDKCRDLAFEIICPDCGRWVFKIQNGALQMLDAAGADVKAMMSKRSLVLLLLQYRRIDQIHDLVIEPEDERLLFVLSRLFTRSMPHLL